MNLKVDGVDQGTVYTSVGNSNIGSGGQIVQAMQFDATSLSTGVYPYDLTVTNIFSTTTRSNFKVGEVLVKNLSDSAFGSGWSMGGLSRLYIQVDGNALIDDGDGSLSHFKARISTLTPPMASGAQVGSALKFDGINDYITFPTNSGNIMKTLPLTVEAWVRPELRFEDTANPDISHYGVSHSSVVNNVIVTSNVGGVIEKGHGIGVNIYGNESNITVTRHHANQNGGSTNYLGRRNIKNPALSPDTWYHVAVVYTSGNHKTYLNGELIDDASYPQGNVTTGGSLLRMGRIVHCCFSAYFYYLHHKGAIDEVRIWQSERTQQEIQDNMSVQLVGSESGLVYYSKIDEGQGQTITDSTGGGNNGTLGLDTSVTDNDPAWITYKAYNRDTDGDFIAPAGDYTALFQNADGTFTRKMKDGTIINYNTQGLQTSVIDRNGNATSYQYDAQGRLISITDPVGLVTTLTYAGGRLSSVTNPAGRTTVFEHDGAGNFTKITDPDGTFRLFSYDSTHRLISQTSKRGFVTTYQYNSAGRNTGATRPDGSVVSLSPQFMSALIDPSTGVGTESNPAPVVRTNQIIATYTDGNGKQAIYTLNKVFGSVREVTDALGREILIVRDANNNITQYTDPRGNVTVMTYDDIGNLLTTTNQSINATMSFTYTDDGFNQVETITDPKGNVTTFNYDNRGNLTSTVDALNNQTTMTYNSRGLLLSSTDALSNTVSFEYDLAKGNLIRTRDQLLNETLFTLDSAGNVVMQVDAEGKATQFVYDSMNRIVQSTDPDLADTEYSYDPAGNLASVKDFRNSTTTFTYDTLNRLLSRTDPLGNTETVAYDGNGNPVSTTDRKNQTITFEYDAANQLIKKTLPGTLVTTFTYDNSGNRLTANDPDSKLTMTYDGANRLKSVATTGSPNQPGITINYTYDLSSNRITLSSTPTGTINYVYDALNRLTSISNGAGQTVSYSYDQISRRTQATYPNGVITDYFYDPKSQLLSLVNRLGITSISTFDYSYDRVGNRTSMGTVRTGGSGNSPLIAYTYDNLYRLVEATSPLSGQFDEVFLYDAVGNRLRKNGQTMDAVFNMANRLLEDQEFTYTYDNNGNLIEKTNKSTSEVTQYTYDGENRLIQVSKPGTAAIYRYDALGRRIEKNVNGVVTRYIYDGEDIVLEYNGSNVLTAKYTHGGGIDEPLIMERGGQSYFYQIDGLGSITELMDSNGTVAQSYVYNSFGQIVNQSGSLANPYTYTGREYDSESGLYYYRARYYDASIGRFLQEDPIGFVGGDINLYTYVFDNPINFIDPSGLQAVESITIGGLIGGAGVAAGAITAGSFILTKEFLLPEEDQQILDYFIDDIIDTIIAPFCSRGKGDKAQDAVDNLDSIRKAQEKLRKVGKGEKIRDISKTKQNEKQALKKIKNLKDLQEEFDDL